MRSDSLYLADIIDAVEAIERFTAGLDEKTFLADELVQSAVLQKLSVIGEAAARLSETTRAAMPSIPWKKSLAFAISRCTLIFRWIGVSSSSRSPTTCPH